MTPFLYPGSDPEKPKAFSISAKVARFSFGVQGMLPPPEKNAGRCELHFTAF